MHEYTCIYNLQQILQKVYIHPSKKVTQHDFDRLYLFYPEFLFIKLDIRSLKSLFICPSIDALFVRIVSLRRV